MASAGELLVEVEEPLEDERSGRFREAFALLCASKIGLVGAVLTALVLLVGVAGTVVLVTPSLHHLYLDQSLEVALRSPGTAGRGTPRTPSGPWVRPIQLFSTRVRICWKLMVTMAR